MSRALPSGTSDVVSTAAASAIPTIFDRQARRARRDRIAGGPPTPMESFVADALLERLEAVKPRLDRALVINTGSGLLATALRGRGMMVSETDHGRRFAMRSPVLLCDEDALTVDAGSFDLVVAAAGFDTVNDLPGALVLARRALRPDGLFLGAMIAAPSLPVLRRAVVEVDAAQGVASPRMHPLLDLRAAGDLLVRAGLALGVADVETLDLSYPGLGRLLEDLRACGMTSVLASRRPVARDWLAQVSQRFDGNAVEGRVRETVSLLMLTGWSPHDSQQRPAARGSGQASLTAVLPPPSPQV